MTTNGVASPLVPVAVGACRCSGTPHLDGDVVYLYPELSMPGGIAAQVALAFGETPESKVAGMYQAIIDHGIADWTFVDAKGEKVPISPATIRGALAWLKGGADVAGKAIELYGGIVAAPFPAQAQKRKRTRTTDSSPSGPTAAT